MLSFISKESELKQNLTDFHVKQAGTRRLNLGCGNDYREGYVNVDMNAYHKTDLVSDVTWLESIEDCSCSEVVAQDVLEHIPRARATTALREWNRVLKVGGKLSLRVPSLSHLLGLLISPHRQSVQQQKNLIQCLYGTQGYEGDFHFNGFTEITLRHELGDAGFELADLRIIDEWMFEVDARKISHVTPAPMLRLVSDEEFIRAAYLQFLDRMPDSEGQAYYATILQKGIARESVIESLTGSSELSAKK
jgi:SAM-dependent methyltransferase